MTTNIDHEEVVRQVVARLQEKHPRISPDEVERTTRDELAALQTRPVQDYLIILTERAANKRLKS